MSLNNWASTQYKYFWKYVNIDKLRASIFWPAIFVNKFYLEKLGFYLYSTCHACRAEYIK